MRRLTDEDLQKILGTTVNGYRIEAVRLKREESADSDHYGILLGKNESGNYVTWQFHIDDDETINTYWGHYTENFEDAIRDFDSRDLDVSLKTFTVTITETLKLKVEVEAHDQQEAEQIVSENWQNSLYILDSDNFAGVEFEAIPED